MRPTITPELLSFVVTLCQMALIGLGIIIAGATVVYAAMFWKGNISGAGIARILQQTDVPKLATVILIVMAASLLGMLGVIEGEAVIALLSGIAGYVLGNRAAPKEAAQD
jgi:hypothetical protein